MTRQNALLALLVLVLAACGDEPGTVANLANGADPVEAEAARIQAIADNEVNAQIAEMEAQDRVRSDAIGGGAQIVINLSEPQK